MFLTYYIRRKITPQTQGAPPTIKGRSPADCCHNITIYVLDQSYAMGKKSSKLGNTSYNEGKNSSKAGNVFKSTEHKSEILHIPSMSQPPYLAVVSQDSNLKIIDLKGRSSNVVKIPDNHVRDIVTIDGEVYAVTKKKILNIDKDGKATSLVPNLDKYNLGISTQVVAFQHQIYILRSSGENMIRFNPADETVNDDSPGCRLGGGFCCCASDDFIYAMGGLVALTSAMKYDPLTNMWTDIKPTKHERLYSAAAALNNRIYVLGGAGDPPPEFYDPQTSTWIEISRMNVYRMDFSACVINNQLYAVGGNWSEEDNRPQQNSVEVYDENQWKILTEFEMREFMHACVWPHAQAESPHETNHNLEKEESQSSSEPSKELDARIHEGGQEKTFQTQKNKNVKQKRCNIKLAGVKIQVPEGALRNNEEASFSVHTVTTQEDGLTPAAPRLICNSLTDFSEPVSVEMETSVSAPAGESIPLILHQRDNANEEWRETEHLNVGDRNRVKYKLHGGGETMITINFRKWKKMIADKIRKMGKAISEYFKIKVHAIVNFYIHLETGQIAVSFCKDQKMQETTEKEFEKNKFTNFSVISHPFIANMDSLVTQTMECKHPAESKISDEVHPSPSFILNEEFLAKGREVIYFELDPEPEDHWKKIKLLYGYSLNGVTERNFPLKVKWPLQETARDRVETRRTEAEAQRSQTETPRGQTDIQRNPAVVIQGPVGQVVTGNANIASGDNCVAGSQHIDRSVVAGNIHEGEAHVNTAGGSTTVSRS